MISDIYITTVGEDVPVDEALEILTEEFIEDGNTCDQTVIDLRNALKDAVTLLKQHNLI